MTDDTKRPEHLKLVEETAPTDVFNDLSSLRKAATITVSRRVLPPTPKVGKPPDNWYFRTHPDPSFTLDCSVIIDGDGNTLFVTPRMLQHHCILPRLRKVTIVTVVCWPGGGILLWPVPIIIDGSQRIPVWVTYRRAMELARTQWVQLVWNADRRDADIGIAENITVAPAWPEQDFTQLLKAGFADGIVDAETHPYVMQLRGLAE
jgi:hypothetical protein